MAKTAMDLVQAAKAAIQQISVSQSQQMLDDDSIALDVREPDEFSMALTDVGSVRVAGN